MSDYLIRRLLLLPLTLLCILLINFVIINLAPGDPVTITQMSADGNASRSADKSQDFKEGERYLQFREHYGLTLPILFNTWPFLDKTYVKTTLDKLLKRNDQEPLKDYDALKLKFGNQARFIMPWLLEIIQDQNEPLSIRALASRFFARGGTRTAHLGANITSNEMSENQKISSDNIQLQSWVISSTDSEEDVAKKVVKMSTWYTENELLYRFEPTRLQKIYIFFFENRFFRYMSRVATLNFGTLRNDDNKSVISEVTRRFKYSLTLAVIPMLITFVLCQVFGCLMAYRQNEWPDYMFSLVFLILYALPVFVVGPFLIEMAVQQKNFPFTHIAIPLSGFTSPSHVYDQLNTYQRLFDIMTHIFLPLLAITYGSLAAHARLSRTAVLEVVRQDYIRTALAKGVPRIMIMFKHVGRNAGITIVTSIASSLGVILGGSLIVETLFEINGFGKFFYEAVVNRDYNVIMFSSIAGSFLTLIGYLAADIAYTVLDPRVTLE